MNDKSTKIKQIISKIDLDKIANYLKEYPSSKTLKQIVKYSKRALESNDEKAAFKLGVKLAYNLDTICDPDKADYVKRKKKKSIG